MTEDKLEIKIDPSEKPAHLKAKEQEAAAFAKSASFKGDKSKVFHVNVEKSKEVKTEKSLTRRIFGTLFLIFASIFMFGMIYIFVVYAKDLPDENTLANYRPIVTSRFYAADGSLLKEHSTERRVFVPAENMPDLLVKAFISAEDKNFYNHNGIDFQGIIRAVITNIKNQGKRRLVGASTITQQVAKNFFTGDEVTFSRKIKEAILALKIDKKYSKNKIITLYMNQIFLGWRSFGVAAAALSYFDKTLEELTLGEMAYLAALPKGPNNYHPINKKEAAIYRRNWVLERMFEDGYITQEQLEAAKEEDLVASTKMRGERPKNMDYFAEEVRKYLEANYGEDALREGGYVVKTTADPKLQDLATKALRKGIYNYDRGRGWRGPLRNIEVSEDWVSSLLQINTPLGAEYSWKLAVVLGVSDKEAKIGLPSGEEAKLLYDDLKWAKKNLPDQEVGDTPKSVKEILNVGDVILTERVEEKGTVKYLLRQIPDLEGAVVALEPHTGRILAQVGGFSFEKSNYNRASQARRQPGSTIKPFIYLTALERGYTPSSLLLDAPVVMEKESGDIWKPDNYNKDFQGEITLRRSLENSINNSTLKLALDIGVTNVLKNAVKYGVYKEVKDPNLSKAIGSDETSPLDMAAAYGMLVNGGKKIKPYFIERVQDRDGSTIFRHDERDCPGCDDEYKEGSLPPVLEDTRPQLTDPITVYQIVNILQGAVQRGTGKAARVYRQSIAGKTGTSNDAKDVWFVGFSPDLVIAIYFGFDSPKTLGKHVAGGGMAAPIFREIMGEYLKNIRPIPFRVPQGINFVKVNLYTGAPVDDEDDPSEIINEVFRPGDEDKLDANMVFRSKKRGGFVSRVTENTIDASREEDSFSSDRGADVDKAQSGGGIY